MKSCVTISISMIDFFCSSMVQEADELVRYLSNDMRK
jgi:hypothetical protein